jgi:hypothetical protein
MILAAQSDKHQPAFGGLNGLLAVALQIKMHHIIASSLFTVVFGICIDANGAEVNPEQTPRFGEKNALAILNAIIVQSESFARWGGEFLRFGNASYEITRCYLSESTLFLVINNPTTPRSGFCPSNGVSSLPFRNCSAE